MALGFCYGTIHAPFALSVSAMREREVEAMSRGGHVYVRHTLPQGGLYIDHNRNIIVQRFMKTDADWLLQIDTDILFPPDIVEQLLRVAGEDCRIIAASVPLPMDDGIHSCGYMRTNVPGVWANVPPREVSASGTDVDGIATAVSMIHREVFERIADRHGQKWFLKTEMPNMVEPTSAAAWNGDGPMKDRQYIPIGEDLAFSLRAILEGYRCRVVRLRGLKHYKTGPISHDDEELDVMPVEAAR